MVGNQLECHLLLLRQVKKVVYEVEQHHWAMPTWRYDIFGFMMTQTDVPHFFGKILFLGLKLKIEFSLSFLKVIRVQDRASILAGLCDRVIAGVATRCTVSILMPRIFGVERVARRVWIHNMVKVQGLKRLNSFVGHEFELVYWKLRYVDRRCVPVWPPRRQGIHTHGLTDCVVIRFILRYRTIFRDIPDHRRALYLLF